MSRPAIWTRQRCEGPREQTLDFACDDHPVVLGILQAAARVRVGVGAAADGHHRDRPRMRAFDRLAGVAGPVAAELVEVAAERRAVAGVVDHHGPHRAIGGGDAEHGERVIDGSAGIVAEEDALVARFAAIDREAGRSLGPGESSRVGALRERHARPARSCRSARGCSGRSAPVDRRAQAGRRSVGRMPASAGRAVGMRRADHEPLAGESDLFLEPPRDLLGHVSRGRRSCRP